jgi:hypothetical protein
MVAKTQLERIEGAIFGNGREGLIAVNARIEENIKAVKEEAENAKNEAVNAAQAAARAAEASKTETEKVRKEQTEGFMHTDQKITILTEKVEKLADSVDAHHKTEHLSDIIKDNPSLKVITEWMKKPNFLISVAVFLMVVYVILHIIATYVPNVWNGIMLLIKLPSLSIPLN